MSIVFFFVILSVLSCIHFQRVGVFIRPMPHSSATKLFGLEDQPTTAIGMFSRWKTGALAKECTHILETETGQYAQDHKREIQWTFSNSSHGKREIK